MKTLIGLVLLSILASSPQGVSAATSGDVAQFVAAFNTGRSDAIDAYVHAHVLPPRPGAHGPDTSQSLQRLRKVTGTLSLASVNMLPRRIVATVRAQSGGWYALNFFRVPNDPHSFRDITADLGLPPKSAAQTPQQYVSELASGGFFSGVVLSAAIGARPSLFAVGFANRETGIQNTADTRFNIGSIGKLFTITAVYQLIERGVLQKSDTIGKWLPDYPNAEARGATIDQLLSMRSGIGDFFGPRFAKGSPERIRTLQDYLPYFAADPLAFKPGTDQMYSNGGFLVLGLIVEKSSGQDFYSYIKEHIFDPAGMTDTSYPSIDETLPDRAVGYTRQWSDLVTYATALRPVGHGEPGRGSSAGGAFSTAGDLFKFSQALQNGSLVKGKYEWNGPGNSYAGGTPGWNAALDMEKGSTLVVLSNVDPPAAEDLIENLQAQ